MRLTLLSFVLIIAAQASHADTLPIADAHVHYSHDSVELTPPQRVIEIMREANLKFALVSSSDDNGTQLLSDLAPDLIVPGLRPYRRRGELNTWFTDPAALEYVEKLLSQNKYATIGEFHLYGKDVELEIPRRIVQLADEYNLVLHAHSDADAVTRILEQNSNVKVLWAHSGFESPEDIANLLREHDRLWADLAFRSEVGSGGSLSDDWIDLFTEFPHRMMLGTDTYTPERMYFIPSHAESSRVWLNSLPNDLAINVAWKNAHDLLMPVWEANRESRTVNPSGTADKITTQTLGALSIDAHCNEIQAQPDLIGGDSVIASEIGASAKDNFQIRIRMLNAINVSKPVTAQITYCGATRDKLEVSLDASMPAHGHGMNYNPEHTVLEQTANGQSVLVEGIVLHMPGKWQWDVDVISNEKKQQLVQPFQIQ